MEYLLDHTLANHIMECDCSLFFIDELPPHTRDFSRELGGLMKFVNYF